MRAVISSLDSLIMCGAKELMHLPGMRRDTNGNLAPGLGQL